MQSLDIGGLVGLVGGSIALLRSAADFFRWWRNRGHVEVVILRTQYYVGRYRDDEVNKVFGPKGSVASLEDAEYYRAMIRGKIKETFSILEFEIRNEYPIPIGVFRSQIDDWIFSDHYTRSMYGLSRDYQVFDLKSKERVNLADYILVSPHDVIARRVEIFEQASAKWTGPGSRPSVPEKQQLNLKVNSSKGTFEKPIPVTQTADYNRFIYVARWSGAELVPMVEGTVSGEPRP